MTHPPASRNYSEQQAGSLRAGDHLILPDGNRSAEVHRVEIEADDFGTPAMVLATLSGGGVLRIAAGSTIRTTPDAEPGAGTPDAADFLPAGTADATAAEPSAPGTSDEEAPGAGLSGTGLSGTGLSDGVLPDGAPTAVVVPP